MISEDCSTIRWSYFDNMINHRRVLICSNCHSRFNLSPPRDIIDVTESYYLFCPRCGARMIQEEDE